jgi:hypothetical protein
MEKTVRKEGLIPKKAFHLIQDRVGWDVLLSPDIEIPDEVMKLLALYGVKLQAIEQMRAYRALPERDRAKREVARGLYFAWVNCLKSAPGPMDDIPFHDEGSAWRNIPNFNWFWRKNRERMQDVDLSVEDIENWIIRNPKQYPPLVSSRRSFQRFSAQKKIAHRHLI